MRKIAFTIIAVAFLPMSDAVAQTKNKTAKPQSGANCSEQARTSCPGFGVGVQACYRAAFARCKQGR